MGKYLHLERVDLAVRELRDLGLGRADATVIRWLALKYLGLTADTEIELTSAEIEQFANKYFYLEVGSGYGYFNPFAGAWYARSDRTDWAVQTLYTQLTRGSVSQRERPMYETPQRIQDAKGLRYRFATRPRAAYLTGLSSIVPRKAKKIVPEHLAVWRFRIDVVDDDAELVDLTRRMLKELHVDQGELAAIFAAVPESSGDLLDGATRS